MKILSSKKKNFETELNNLLELRKKKLKIVLHQLLIL